MTYPVERIQRFPVRASVPAPGADWFLTPTGRGAWRILSLTATLATSAAVATRAVAFTVDDQTSVFLRTPAVATQAASLTIHYDTFDGASPSALIGTDQVFAWPNGGPTLYEGYFLRSVTAGIDVADQWSNIVALVEELPSGARVLMTPVELSQGELW